MIQVTDDLSGVKSVSGNVRSPSGVGIMFFEAQAAGEGAAFTARLKIPDKAESGDWNVGDLFVYDKASNPLILSFTPATVPAGGKFQVVSRDSDATAPDVRIVSMEKATMAGGEKNTIRVEAVDEQSGMAGVTGAFQAPSKAALIWFACHLNAETNLWEGEIAVPANAECGEWMVQHLRVSDKAGNVAFLSKDSPPLLRANFLVSSPERCDGEAPILSRLDLSPTVVSNEASAEIAVTASVHDEGSGMSFMSGWAEGPLATNGQVPRVHFTCLGTPNEPDAWTCKISVPRYAAKGIWKLALLRVEDRAHNTRDYHATDAVLAGAVFRVD